MSEPNELKVAALTQAELSRVEEIEKQLGGVYVVAYEQPVTPAPLSAEQVKKLQSLERELGVCLIAYQRPRGV